MSIPDELKELLDARAEADQVPVSYVVSEALRGHFSLPSQPPTPAGPPPGLAEEVRAIQAWLWDLHFSHECTRSTALNLYYWAGRNGETLGMPPEQEMQKPTWSKPAEPAPDHGKKPKIQSKNRVGKPVK